MAKLGLAVVLAALAAGCSSSPSQLQSFQQPSYLGAAPPPPEWQTSVTDTSPRVSAGKVLSAIVFERVTGLEVDPARLVER
jgi:hypothetical protein